MTYFAIRTLVIFVDRFRNIHISFCWVIISLSVCTNKWKLTWRLFCYLFLILTITRYSNAKISVTIILKIRLLSHIIESRSSSLVINIRHLTPAISNSIHFGDALIMIAHVQIRLTILHHDLFINEIYLLLKLISLGL